MIKRIAIAFGVVFLIAGVLGFVPGVTSFPVDDEHGRLLGTFAVDSLHNGVHLLTGLVAIMVGFMSEAASRTFFKVFGVIYGVVALLGFGFGNAAIFGMMANNMPDAVLHAVVAVVALFLGFGHLLDRFEHPGSGTQHPI